MVNGGKMRSHTCLIYLIYAANIGKTFFQKRRCTEIFFDRHSQTIIARKKFLFNLQCDGAKA